MCPFFRSEGVFQRVVLTSLDGRWINFTLRPEPDHPKDQEDEAMKNRFIPRGLIFCITCIIAVTAFAQGKASRGREGNAEDFVVVPDEQAMAAKQNVLKKIDSVAGRAQQAPNVVLILADDLGYADTAVYGSRSIPTPHIDALADAGVRFTEAYVTAATCSPSRAALMTGRYQQRFGFEFNTSSAAITHRESRGLDPAVVTLADVFQRAGYATGMFGKWHLGTRDYFHPQQRGFDEFFGFLAGAHSFFPAELDEPAFSSVMRGREPLIEPEYLTDALARETVAFIKSHAGKPFFAYVPFNAVHTPIEAAEKYLRRFPDVTNRQQRTYNAMTSALDDAVGRIVRALDETGTRDETLVIFLNDNGGPLYTKVQSNGPLRLGKLFLFEGGIRVPMIVSWPQTLEAGKVYHQPTSALDVFATACAAAGISLPPELTLDGVDLLPYLRGERTESPHEALFWSNGPNKAVRMGKWKLIIVGKHKFLFDLESDLGETNNLAEADPDELQKLERAWKGWQSRMQPPAWPCKPDGRIIDIDGVPYQLNI